jgi:hypothetical protein
MLARWVSTVLEREERQRGHLDVRVSEHQQIEHLTFAFRERRDGVGVVRPRAPFAREHRAKSGLDVSLLLQDPCDRIGELGGGRLLEQVALRSRLDRATDVRGIVHHREHEDPRVGEAFRESLDHGRAVQSLQGGRSVTIRSGSRSSDA